jgi:hypothetical protein
MFWFWVHLGKCVCVRVCVHLCVLKQVVYLCVLFFYNRMSQTRAHHTTCHAMSSCIFLLCYMLWDSTAPTPHCVSHHLSCHLPDSVTDPSSSSLVICMCLLTWHCFRCQRPMFTCHHSHMTQDFEQRTQAEMKATFLFLLVAVAQGMSPCCMATVSLYKTYSNETL